MEFQDLSECNGGLFDDSDVKERRENLRLEEAFPAKARGVNDGGKVFESEAIVKSISVKGLYLRLKQRVEPGARLFIIVQFSKASVEWGIGARVAIHGLVLRSQPAPGGEDYGVAVATIHHRFL